MSTLQLHPQRPLCVVASLTLASLAPSLVAQVAPSAPKSTPAPEEAIQLSPFVVATEQDIGWSANDTLSATRTKQALKDVPLAIDAITSDFMADLGLFTVDEVAEFVANAYTPPLMENDGQSGSVSFRGLTGSTASRNYFRWYIPSDTYNVERVDFGKGSNSLIYGDVEPGGQASVFTKRAQFRNFGEVYSSFNHYGAYRLQLDYNRKITDKVALRFNAVKREERTFQDASEYGLEGQTLTTSWRPFRDTFIRVEYERGDFENARGYAGLTVRERSGRSRAFTTDRLYYTSDGEYLQRSLLPSADRSNAGDGGLLTLMEGQYVDVKMRNAAGAEIGTKRVFGLPKEYNIRGSFDRQARPFYTYTATIEQRVGPIGLEFSYNHQKQTAIRTDNFFSNTITLDVNGRPYVETELDEKNFGNIVDQFRLTAVYNFDKLSWMKQTFILGADYREDWVMNYRFNHYNVKAVENGTATTFNANADRVRLRLYLDDPRFYSRALFDSMRLSALPETPTVHIRKLASFPSGTSSTDGTEWRQASAVSFSTVGSYFKNRVHTLIGIRRDFNRVHEYVGTRTFGPFNEEIRPPKRPDALPGEYVENQELHLQNTLYSGGVSITLTKNLSLYGQYGESFRFQGLRTFDRERFGPILGVNKEVGLKGNFFGGKVEGSLAAYDTDRQNVALSFNGITGISFDATEIEDLMNPNDVLPGDPRYKYAEVGTASAARNYRSTENSRGLEGTVIFRPFKGLQIRLAGARTDVTGQPDLSSFRAYYDAAVARGNESPTLLRDAKFLLDSLDVDTKPAAARASPWSGSWAIMYSLPARNEWMRGTSLNLTGRYRDDYLFGIVNGQEMIGGGSHLVNGSISHNRRILGKSVTFRFDVKNIADLENGKFRKTQFSTLLSGENVYRYSYVMPTEYAISLRVRF